MRKLKDKENEKAKTENRKRSQREDRLESETANEQSHSKAMIHANERFHYIRREIVFSQDNEKDVVLLPDQDFNSVLQIQEFESTIVDANNQDLIRVLESGIVLLAITSRFVGEEGFRVNLIKDQFFVLIDLVTFREYRPFVAAIKLSRAIRDRAV